MGGGCSETEMAPTDGWALDLVQQLTPQAHVSRKARLGKLQGLKVGIEVNELVIVI